MPQIAWRWVRFETDPSDPHDFGGGGRYGRVVEPEGLQEDGVYWITTFELGGEDFRRARQIEPGFESEVDKFRDLLAPDAEENADGTNLNLSLCLLRRSDGKVLQLVHNEPGFEEQQQEQMVDWFPTFAIGDAIVRFDITLDATACHMRGLSGQDAEVPLHVAIDPREPDEGIQLIEDLDELLQLVESPAAAHLWK